MKLTIIPSDKTVYKDGKSYANLDLVGVPSNVHALQFNDATNKGWLEFLEDDEGNKARNEVLTELPSWAADALEKWIAAEIADNIAIEEARIASEQAALEQQQSTGTV